MNRKTPHIGARGRYTLKTPWVTDPATAYECIALRSFNDMYARNIDVLTEIFLEHDLTEDDYEENLDAGVLIVTIADDDNNLIYVPDSYIESYPDMGAVDYMHLVISASIGPIPNYMSVGHLQEQVTNIIQDVIGVEPEVFLNRVPHKGVISPQNHEDLEIARLQAVNNRTSDWARLRRIEEAYNQLLDDHKILQQYIIDNYPESES